MGVSILEKIALSTVSMWRGRENAAYIVMLL